jgi:hypothetical protein
MSELWTRPNIQPDRSFVSLQFRLLKSPFDPEMVDADRLDYLWRDRLMTGAEHGGLGQANILSHLKTDRSSDTDWSSKSARLFTSKIEVTTEPVDSPTISVLGVQFISKKRLLELIALLSFLCLGLFLLLSGIGVGGWMVWVPPAIASYGLLYSVALKVAALRQQED